MSDNLNVITLEYYTDGSALKDKSGATASAVFMNGKLLETESHRCSLTTNNQMEILAVYNALLHLRKLSDTLLEDAGTEVVATIYTDSQYVSRTLNEWIKGWIAKGWRNSSGEVLNRDLWEVIEPLHAKLKKTKGLKLKIEWVRGHNGHVGNTLADGIANGSVLERMNDLPVWDNYRGVVGDVSFTYEGHEYHLDGYYNHKVYDSNNGYNTHLDVFNNLKELYK